MIKKISAAVLAFVLAASVLTGCKDKEKNKKNDSSSTTSSSADKTQDNTQTAPDASLIIDGKQIDTKDLVVCTIDGRDVDFDTFRYYYYYTLNQLGQTYGVTLDSIKNTEGGFDSLLESVITNIKQDYVTYRLCEDNSVSLSDDEKKEVDKTYDSNLKQSGSEEAFNKELKNHYMTPELYKTMLEFAQLYQKASDQLFTNGGKYATSKEDFKNIVQDKEKYACVRSILIPYSAEAEITDKDTADSYDSLTLDKKFEAKQSAYAALDENGKKTVKEKSKKIADEVLKKAKDGSEFTKLIEEYGWDPGMVSSPDGYYVTPKTSFVQEYLDAAFKLDENSVSDLVSNESYGGWFIIKRFPVDMDYVDENIDDMIQEYDLPARQKLYSDTMENMKVSYSDTYKKLTIDSIT